MTQTAGRTKLLGSFYPDSYCSADTLILDNPRVRAAIPMQFTVGLKYTSGTTYRLKHEVQFCTKIRAAKTLSYKVTD